MLNALGSVITLCSVCFSFYRYAPFLFFLVSSCVGFVPVSDVLAMFVLIGDASFVEVLVRD